MGALFAGRTFDRLAHGELDDRGAWLGPSGLTFFGRVILRGT
jgi:hypothetical protein